VIVVIVALPLAIAFAIASGVTPAQGLYTAIIAGFLISALGGSRVQIGGPTGAFVVVVYAIVQQYGASGLAAATLMAGVILVLLGNVRAALVVTLTIPLSIALAGLLLRPLGIGLNTMTTLRESNVTAMSVTADKTLIFDREETLAAANQHKIAILGK